jgi:uncharacterized Tic20 family protein
MPVADAESERRFSVVAHASALLGLILPLGQILGPYLTRLLMPAHASLAHAHAAESLNFQLNVSLVFVLLLAALLWFRGGWWYFTLFVPNLYAFTMALWGANRASRGCPVRYPFVVRVIDPPDQPPSAA